MKTKVNRQMFTCKKIVVLRKSKIKCSASNLCQAFHYFQVTSHIKIVKASILVIHAVKILSEYDSEQWIGKRVCPRKYSSVVVDIFQKKISLADTALFELSSASGEVKYRSANAGRARDAICLDADRDLIQHSDHVASQIVYLRAPCWLLYNVIRRLLSILNGSTDMPIELLFHSASGTTHSKSLSLCCYNAHDAQIKYTIQKAGSFPARVSMYTGLLLERAFLFRNVCCGSVGVCVWERFLLFLGSFI
jgi:hypothetical protein